jgi:Raf kinase inhibitor-like YbhB/YbcL family protein
MDDPDAPDPNAPEMVWVHWVVYNIPPDTRSLPENAARDRAWLPLHGLNDWGSSDPSDPRARYGGPNPPIGRHRYFFKLYALDIRLDLRGAPATKSQIEKAVRGHVLLNEYLIGTYQKKA